ncbi:ac34 [Hemileuca sp. nucleopolyhedrovirus]|uniref:Ac34 n=1 Tax=Hemileuca sp. nucleopolyhedrovirus TaxID=1367203 RepID=S5MK00_9ABAC|nr:ac34 [Hemileuca sp. nucleopolyhedrovirus]AGR56776.1 ac34 [Hemileuca sp. nucleopolyhedrovirus]
MKDGNDDNFAQDLARLTIEILNGKSVDPESKLGDIISYMGRNKLLLTRKKEEMFDIKETIELCDETRVYLNVLQTEKLKHCRLCYQKDDQYRCEFHKKYIFNKDSMQYYDEYVDFLNSDMGIISFVELYYSYMNVEFWKITGKFIFRDLTGFDSVKALLEHYNHTSKDDVDEPSIESMDTDV